MININKKKILFLILNLIFIIGCKNIKNSSVTKNESSFDYYTLYFSSQNQSKNNKHKSSSRFQKTE